MTIHNDSISHYSSLTVSEDSSYFRNYKLGQLYFSKATLQYSEQLEISVDSLGKNYPWQYLDSSMYYLDKSIEQNGKYPPSLFARALTREYLEHKDKLIIKDYSKAIKLSPESWLYYLYRANYISFSNPKDAIKDYNKTITLKPSDYRAYVGRASTRADLRIDLSLEQKTLIENDYKRALKLDCDSASVLLSRAATRIYDTENYIGAITDLTKVIEMKPNLLRAYYERASAYYFNKQFELSCEDFKKWRDMGASGWVWYIKESCGIEYESWMKKE